MSACNMNNFHPDRPFTAEDAENYKDENVAVKVFDSGLTRIYEGVLTEITETTIKVGDEVLLNECVRTVNFL